MCSVLAPTFTADLDERRFLAASSAIPAFVVYMLLLLLLLLVVQAAAMHTLLVLLVLLLHLFCTFSHFHTFSHFSFLMLDFFCPEAPDCACGCQTWVFDSPKGSHAGNYHTARSGRRSHSTV
jgi:hypothetical protein